MVDDQELAKLTPSSDSCPSASIILYGRQVPRLFHNHHCLLARPNSRCLPRLLDCSLSTVRVNPFKIIALSLETSLFLTTVGLTLFEALVAKPVLLKAVHSGESRWIFYHWRTTGFEKQDRRWDLLPIIA